MASFSRHFYLKKLPENVYNQAILNIVQHCNKNKIDLNEHLNEKCKTELEALFFSFKLIDAAEGSEYWIKYLFNFDLTYDKKLFQ